MMKDLKLTDWINISNSEVTWSQGPRHKRSRVDLCHRPSVHVPQVEPGSGAGDDVAGQLVDGHGRHRPDVPGHVLDVDVAGKVPDDGGAVARPRDGDTPAWRENGQQLKFVIQSLH